MELQELYSLMDRFAASGLTALEWEHEGERVALRREGTVSQLPAAAPAAAPVSPVQAEEQGEVVAAPLVGVFYAAPAPEEPPFIEVGQQVKKGDTLFIIEAMKTMNEIPAPCDGTISHILAQSGDMVEYGQVVVVMEEKQ